MYKIVPSSIGTVQMAQNDTSQGRPLFWRFWACASGFWERKHARVSWLLTVALVAIALAQIAVQYRLNYWNRDFFNALERRDAARLWEEAWLFAPLAGLSILLSVASVWARMTTQRKWREWLTKLLLALWLKDGRYRGLKFVTAEHQNAEYRICVDARIATDAPIDMALGIFSAFTTAIVFTGVLWTIGGSLTISVGGHQVTIPGYLVLGVGLFSFLFTTGMMIIGRKLPAIIQSENQAEAEMLAAASKIRESGEEAARPGEESPLRSAVWLALRQVLERWRQLCWQLMRTTMVSQMDLLLAPVFAWILCAPKYLAGTMTLGELTQASAAFVILQLAFNWLVDNFQRFSDWRAATNRVATLLLALDQVESGHETPPSAPEDRERALGGQKQAESQA
jgi:vitamin B12/bleomycin/antimicrobial peptide transport system ATP-binding/permease protein